MAGSSTSSTRTSGFINCGCIEFAAVAVIAIAAFGALCSYVESYMTSSVGQWVTRDLRSTLYEHIQHLPLAYHKQAQTGDFLSRLTTDIDAVQSFVVSGLVGLITDGITLLGMVGVMFYLNWRFTLLALSVAPDPFSSDLLIYPPQQEGVSRSSKKAGPTRIADAGTSVRDWSGQGVCTRRV